jgi:hypothetical protein
MFAPKERLEWYYGLALHHHGTGLARGALSGNSAPIMSKAMQPDSSVRLTQA